MIIRYIVFYFGLLGLGSLSCNSTAKKLDWGSIIRKYSEEKNDSLHLASALFLEKNMHGQTSERTVFVDVITGKEKNIRIDTISSYESLLKILTQDNIEFKTTVLSDSLIMTNELIEKNIEMAIADLKITSPQGNLNQNVFFEYILPYKAINEYPEQWRSLVHEKYDNAIKNIKSNNSLSPVNAIRVINADVKSWFKFSLINLPRSWSELCAIKQGDCISMCSIMCFAGRAYGIPIAIDYCPVWANINSSNHFWNSILLPDGKSIPFMGGESDPYEYDPFLLFRTNCGEKEITTFKRAGKVLRKTFSLATNNIHNLLIDQKDIPYTLQDERYRDVTQEYLPVTDIPVQFDSTYEHKISYLCVFNKGKWIPTWWATIDSNKAIFQNMAKNVVYLPAFFENGTVIPCGSPIISIDSNIVNLQPSLGRLISLKIKYLQSVEQEQINLYKDLSKLEWNSFIKMQGNIASNKQRISVKRGLTYILYYWHNRWIQAASTVCNGEKVEFKNVPNNCLYRVVEESNLQTERIFTYKNGTQIWW